MSQNTSITVINLARDAVTRIGRWQTVELTDRWIQVVPVEFATRLPPIGESGRRSAHHWLTLEFWIQDRATGLGMFWWVNPVIDLTTRNATLERLFADGRTGFVRNSVKDWRGLHEFAIAGQTISFDWWPKGGTPSLSSAATSIEAHITGWNQRLGAILAAIESAAYTGHSSVAASTEPAPSVLRPIQRRSPVKQSPAPARTTPPIPAKFRTFRAQPHYTSIFEIYPDETRIYGTEDWHGDWSARVLFMAKDAGSSRIFKPLANGGRG